jgi:excisionase family DNA binding protein
MEANSPPRTLSSYDEEQLLTARQLAEALNLPETWVRERTRAGDIPVLKLGKYRRYLVRDVQAWLSERQAKA